MYVNIEPKQTKKGVRYDLAVYIYPDGHGNITAKGGQNIPVADAAEAMTVLASLWREGRNRARR